MHIDTFKKIARQVETLEKTGVKFDVLIQSDKGWEQGANYAFFEPTFYSVNKLGQLSQLQLILGRPIKILRPGEVVYGNTARVSIPGLKANNCILDLASEIIDEKHGQIWRKKLPTLKYFSPNLRPLSNFKVYAISDTPPEKQEEDTTYRYIGTEALCEMCIPHTHVLYNYLDRGFFYAKVNRLNEKDKIVITNELTPDTYLVMLLCSYHSNFVKTLDNECYLPANKAKLFRIKFEKDLPPEYKVGYDKIKAQLLADYEKVVNSNMLTKVVKGELPVATYNRIKLTKNSAEYEGIKLEAPNMLEYLVERMIFDDRTDIYTLIRGYVDLILADLDAATLPPVTEETPETKIEKIFSVNGAEICVKRTSANTRRSINGHNINIEELAEVCYRSSCFEDAEMYDKFVQSVNSMSLKWHDAIGNGIAVKIHDGLTDLEYKAPNAPSTAPRIKFIKEKDGIYVLTGDGKEDRAPVRLNYVLKQFAQLNRKTNNRYQGDSGYTPRNASWARRQVAKILKEACTFDEKELLTDAEGKPVLNAEGKKQYTVKRVCYLDDEKAKFISKMAQEYYAKAIAKSSAFLAEAVKQTSAKSISFQGEDCWYVEGKLHKYAVVKKTNQVFNYDSGGYVCIVEPGHRVEVGFDATACRLLALKNDAFRVQEVGTLRRG